MVISASCSAVRMSAGEGVALAVYQGQRRRRSSTVGAENLCHLGRCPRGRGLFGQAPGVGWAGLDPSGGEMIFGLWA